MPLLWCGIAKTQMSFIVYGGLYGTENVAGKPVSGSHHSRDRVTDGKECGASSTVGIQWKSLSNFRMSQYQGESWEVQPTKRDGLCPDQAKDPPSRSEALDSEPSATKCSEARAKSRERGDRNEALHSS
jgi:hypothetical protein